MRADFVHLHVHTAYSLCEGAIKTGALAKKATEFGMPAVAMTDINSLAGAPAFTKDITSAGVQPIVGLQAMLDHPGAQGEIVLLAKDEGGYANLVKLTSNSFIRTTDGMDPKVSLEDLAANNGGLIALTGGWRGPVNKALVKGNLSAARDVLSFLKDTFGDRLYVELVRHGQAEEGAHEPQLITLADELELPLVATNDAYFLEARNVEAQDALICINDGTYITMTDRRRASPQAWLKPAAAMRERFSDLPDACDNTIEIAKRCAVAFKKAKPVLPPFKSAEGLSEDETLRLYAKKGLESRLKNKTLDADKLKEYQDRLEFELGVIISMGFSGYFLIVSDFITWAKQNGIPVGPGRGSGAGSIVAWALLITNLDPIEYELLFERFLNPDRVSMPDFDIDFCQERREEVIRYVKDRYGEDRVAQIGTIGKLKAKAAVRDVGRVLQLPYGQVNRFCMQIPDNPADPKSLKEAMQMEPLASEIENAEPSVKRMFEVALGIEGLHRNLSTHAAGVVISGKPIVEMVPVFRDKDGNLATQYDMKGVEDAGLVKFDFLGLKTLDAIQGAIDMLAAQGIEVDFDKIDIADKETYELLAKGESFGVFQLESAGMRKAILQVKPSEIGDIIALNALYRPGPMENIPVYAQVKHGEKQANYLHPLMKKVLKATFGIIVYQEQVMELVRRLAGYTLGQADLVRRAMGKKIKEEMDAQESIFIEGAKAGWVNVETDDGRTIPMHAKSKVKTIDGKFLTLQEAIDTAAEVVI